MLLFTKKSREILPKNDSFQYQICVISNTIRHYSANDHNTEWGHQGHAGGSVYPARHWLPPLLSESGIHITLCVLCWLFDNFSTSHMSCLHVDWQSVDLPQTMYSGAAVVSYCHCHNYSRKKACSSAPRTSHGSQMFLKQHFGMLCDMLLAVYPSKDADQ